MVHYYTPLKMNVYYTRLQLVKSADESLELTACMALENPHKMNMNLISAVLQVESKVLHNPLWENYGLHKKEQRQELEQQALQEAQVTNYTTVSSLKSVTDISNLSTHYFPDDIGAKEI